MWCDVGQHGLVCKSSMHCVITCAWCLRGCACRDNGPGIMKAGEGDQAEQEGGVSVATGRKTLDGAGGWRV